MDDTELYTTLLGIAPPWRVTRVTVNMAAERVDVWLEEAPGTPFRCAVCGQPAPVYDHTAEQVWRHLDTCQCQTYVHARLPRTACPVDGVKQMGAPWAEGRSEYTRGFETRIIDTGKECDVTGVRRLLRTTWDATWGVLERAVRRGLGRTILTELSVLSRQFECLTTQRVIWVGHAETYRLTLRLKCTCRSIPWIRWAGSATRFAASWLAL